MEGQYTSNWLNRELIGGGGDIGNIEDWERFVVVMGGWLHREATIERERERERGVRSIMEMSEGQFLCAGD